MEMFFDGLSLMVIGMGTVLSFLSLLVVSIMGMSKLALHLSPSGSGALSESHIATEGEVPPDHLAAISAAVHRYRRQHGLS